MQNFKIEAEDCKSLYKLSQDSIYAYTNQHMALIFPMARPQSNLNELVSISI